jgi:hypothetical protein
MRMTPPVLQPTKPHGKHQAVGCSCKAARRAILHAACRPHLSHPAVANQVAVRLTIQPLPVVQAQQHHLHGSRQASRQEGGWMGGFHCNCDIIRGRSFPLLHNISAPHCAVML